MKETTIKFTPTNIEDRKNLGIRAGDTVRVWSKIQEKGKTRLQAFEGLVLAVKHGKEAGSMFTVRKVSEGVGVERIFPLYSPSIDRVEILRKSKVRRAKLYYIRDKAAKDVRKKIKSVMVKKVTKGKKEEVIEEEEIENLEVPEEVTAE